MALVARCWGAGRSPLPPEAGKFPFPMNILIPILFPCLLMRLLLPILMSLLLPILFPPLLTVILTAMGLLAPNAGHGVPQPRNPDSNLAPPAPRLGMATEPEPEKGVTTET